ncbi:hypothetical protein ABSA28_00967 [Candidatus Hepatincolaceae symbiont of Richtersius coronifer]
MFNISPVLKEGYNHAVTLNLQQKGSKLAICVREEIQNTQRYFYDRIAPTEAIDVTSRHGNTPLIETQYDRRMVTLITSDWGDLIDKEDQLKMLSDPTSAYALNAAYALGRKKDTRILEAALGIAWTGVKGDVAVPLPASQTIKADYTEGVQAKSATAGSGLTLAKLRMARQILDDADVDDDEEQYCIVTAKQVNDLLKTTEITSDDYNSVRSLVDGKINTFMGFNFKRVSSALLPKNENGERRIVCYAKSGLLLALAGDIKTDISIRADKRMATQVYASLSCGATRMDERKVVEILCKE